MYCQIHSTCHLISCLEGLSEERPGHSCRRLKERNPEYRSGYYWIRHNNVNIAKPYMKVYCEMDDGLGWMMIGREISDGKSENFPEKSRNLPKILRVLSEKISQKITKFSPKSCEISSKNPKKNIRKSFQENFTFLQFFN